MAEMGSLSVLPCCEKCQRLLLHQSSQAKSFMTYDHGVQTGAAEGSVGTGETLSSLEHALEIGLDPESAIGESSTVVETLESSAGASGGGSEPENLSGGRHLCVVLLMF